MRVVRLDLNTSETSALLVKADAPSISFNTFLAFLIASLFSLRLAIYYFLFLRAYNILPARIPCHSLVQPDT